MDVNVATGAPAVPGSSRIQIKFDGLTKAMTVSESHLTTEAFHCACHDREPQSASVGPTTAAPGETRVHPVQKLRRNALPLVADDELCGGVSGLKGNRYPTSGRRGEDRILDHVP